MEREGERKRERTEGGSGWKKTAIHREKWEELRKEPYPEDLYGQRAPVTQSRDRPERGAGQAGEVEAVKREEKWGGKEQR